MWLINQYPFCSGLVLGLFVGFFIGLALVTLMVMAAGDFGQEASNENESAQE